MSDLILESVERPLMAPKSDRGQSLRTWFHLLNLATLAIVCLICIKLYRCLQLIRRWLFPIKETFENPTILVVGPETDIVRSIINRLSRRFNSELVDLELMIRKIPTPTKFVPSKIEKNTLLYTHAPVLSHKMMKHVSNYVEETYGKVDILVIAQNESRVARDSTHSFLTNLNRELLQQFWTVMAFLPGMLRRNNGHIFSIELDGSSLINTGVIRTIHEDLQQSNTKVKLTLMERNTILESFLPSFSTETMARFIVESMSSSSPVVRIPSLSSCLFVLPTSVIGFLMKPILKVSNFNMT